MSEIADIVTTNKGMGAIPSAKGVTFRVWAPHYVSCNFLFKTRKFRGPQWMIM